ncbi:TIGR00153 family protein [Methanocella conradii]|uniref:TIGR00153 family protein n=1 Tax=Methanocella conradii TaxID=1175444 RepID=UPI00157DE151|nr:TIGR00153 family protein [Methanocella conradii]
MMDPLKSLLGLIAKSPFKPLSEHAEKVRITVWKMSDAVNAYVEGDKARVDALYHEISSLEHDADNVKHEIRQNLPSSNIMPVDRADTLSYLKQQDDVANSAENVAEMLTIKMVDMPPAVKDVILRLNAEVLKTVEEHVSASNKIITVLDTAFSPEKVKEAQELINKVDTQKHTVDVTKLEAMRSIYDNEDKLGPVGVYHLLTLIKELGWVAEHAESSSNRLRLMIARK